jgi:hypothetical protein
VTAISTATTNTARDIDRRTFSGGVVAGAAAALFGARKEAEAAVSARNIVFVHGLFADGSCRSEVIGRLGPMGYRLTRCKMRCGLSMTMLPRRAVR